MEKNPELIQGRELPEGDMPTQSTPIFLIHDGGGTTFAYHCLDPLGRPTYGVFNPLFRSGGSFEGGIYGMGRLYASLIRQTCADYDFPANRNSDGSMNLLLGGWSLGGLLSLEIAKVLANDSGVKIIGILMMDSVYTVDLPQVDWESLDRLDLGKSHNAFLSLRAMEETLRVIREWDPPVWTGNEASPRPRTSLLRAVNSLPTTSGDVHLIDFYRHERTLGWDRYDSHLFSEILDVEGNHFEMFSFEHIPGISKAIKTCLDELDKLGNR